jgi:hypothetical protein
MVQKAIQHLFNSEQSILLVPQGGILSIKKWCFFKEVF